MTIEEWIRMGLAQGWCSPPVCATHDGVPTTASEDEEDEPCVHVLRLYRDEDERLKVEENCSPAVWRKQGWE